MTARVFDPSAKVELFDFSRRLGICFVALVVAVSIGISPVRSQVAGEAEPPCPLDTFIGDRVALVVGTDDYSVYQTETVKSLNNAVRDARTVAALLSRQDFKVRCLINPTKLTFDAEKTGLEVYLADRTRQAPVAAADKGRVVIYVAGHGYRDPNPGNGNDYLLFPFDPDPDKYSGVVDLNTHAGRIAQGRFAIQSLINAFNAVNHPVIFAFDACRSVLNVGSVDAAGPAGSISKDRLIGRHIILYSTQPGGFAADDVPNSTERNGLYTSILSRLMNLSLVSVDHTVNLTATVVSINKPDQSPNLVRGPGTAFTGFPWFDGELSDVCDIMDSAIWNAGGRHCERFGDDDCLKQDICKVIKPFLQGASQQQAKLCLARYKDRWLHKDLVGICSSPVPAGAPVGPLVINELIPAAAGIANPADTDAFNVVTTAQSNLSSVSPDFAKVALSGWADKTPSLFAAANRISPEQLASIQGSLDQRLSNISGPATKRTFTTAQREILVAQSSERKVPSHTSPSPFRIDLTGRSVTLRNLPSASASSIGTFSGDGLAAEIDCYTMPCINGWIGLRVTQGKSIVRGWASAEELKTAVVPAVSVEVSYDGKRIIPPSDIIEDIRRKVRPEGSNAPLPGRVQVMALRSSAEDSSSEFLAGARLSYLDRLLIDLGVSPNDIVKTVVDAPSGSQLPAAIINLGRPYTVPARQ